MTTGNTAVAARHTPSVSELQAALLAARTRQPSALDTAPHAATAPPPSPVPPDRAGSGPWLLGTHGGSGVRCLSAVLPGTRLAGKVWPTPQFGREPAVLVCRSNHRGLSSAQDYARAYRDAGLGETLQLLGVIVSADAPGRAPLPLRRLERLLSGAVPILGHAPWEPTWRLGPPQTGADTDAPTWVGTLRDSLSAAIAAARAVPA